MPWSRLRARLEIDPARNAARWDRARSYLYLGNYHQGFADYEIRQFTGQLSPEQSRASSGGGSLMPANGCCFLSSRGFGDTIWAARYLARVKALGGGSSSSVQGAHPLIETLGVADMLIPRDAPLPPADFYCYLCSLPGLFTSDLASIPTSPFLTAPRDRLVKFRRSVAEAGPRPENRCGLVGSVTFKRDQERAQSLLKFFQGFALPGVQLYSLQKGPPEAGCAHFRAAA